MRIFAPRKELITITLLIPIAPPEGALRGTPVDYREEERQFFIREKLRPEAAEFMAYIGRFRNVDPDEADELIKDMLQHVLAHPANGQAILREELDFILDETKIGLLNYQSDIYGIRQEDQRLGNILRPAIEKLSRLKALSSVEKMIPGLKCVSPSPISSESTPTYQSDSGPIESSTITGESPTENGGEPVSSSDSLPAAMNPSESQTGD